MDRVRTRRWSYFFLVIVALLVCISIYILNRIYPVIGEDWDYSFVWDNNGMTTDRVQNVCDILISQYHHYFIWGGRVIVHAIAQLLLLLGSGWHDLINSLAYVTFVWIIYRISTFGTGVKPLVFSIIALLLWFYLPDFTANTLWITYSSVYLWGTLIVISFIYPFYKYYMAQNTVSVWGMSVLMFFGGTLAGWTNENTSLALISFLCMLLLLLRYNKTPIPRWMWWGLTGVLIGCAFMLLAPGNSLRAGADSPPKEYPEWMFRIWRVVRHYFRYLSLLTVVYITLFYFFTKRKEIDNNQKIKLISLVFFISAHVGIIVMVASPQFPARAMFGVITFMVVAVGILLSRLYDLTFRARNITVIICLVFTICFVYDYWDKYKYLSYFNDFWCKREIYLEDQKKQGVENIVFRDTLYFHKNFIIYDFKRFEEGWPNMPYSKYYGVKSVKLE